MKFWAPLPSYEDILDGAVECRKSDGTERTQHTVRDVRSVNKITHQRGDGDMKKDGGADYTVDPLQAALQKLSQSVGVARPPEPKDLQQDDMDDRSYRPRAVETGSRRGPARERVEKTRGQTRSSRTRKPEPPSRKEFSPKVVCRYYMEGVCSKGAKCTFSHGVQPNKTVEEAKVKEPCKFFLAGSCMKGENCYYSHDLSNVPCKFFHFRGRCAAGREGCRFSHDPIDAETLRLMRATEQLRDKERIDEMTKADRCYIPSPRAHSKQEKEAEIDAGDEHAIMLNPFAEVDF